VAEAIEKGALAASKAQFIENVPESSRYGGETIRDKARGALFNLGIDRRGVNTLIGDMRADNIIDNIGLVDLTPVALPAVIQEGARSLKQGDYVSGIVDLAFSALEMAPGVRLASPYVKKLIKIIANKANKAAPVDETKRKLMQGGLAAPIVASSGVLSQLPVEKLPVSKIIYPNKTFPAIKLETLLKEGLDALPSFKSAINKIDIATAKSNIIERGGNLPENLTDKDYLKIAEELKLDDMSDTEFILEQVDDIRDYLDGKISLDEIPSNIELPNGEKISLGRDVIQDLQQNYNMSNDEIAKFLSEQLGLIE